MDQIKNITNSNSIILVPFSIFNGKNELKLAVNVHKVLRVLNMKEMKISYLPDSTQPFFGVLNIDRDSIPLFDLNYFFFKSSSSSEDKRIVVCGFQNKTIGLVADKTKKLDYYETSEMNSSLNFLKIEDKVFFSATISRDEESLHVLDLEGLMNFFGKETISCSQKKDHTFSGKKALIVEDSSLFRKKCYNLLSGYGIEAHTAENGKEALDMLLAQKKFYDLIFTDIEMPIMNGIQMALEIKKDSVLSQIPIIFNSAISNPSFIEDIESQKLGEYVVKFDENVIQEKLYKIWKAS